MNSNPPHGQQQVDDGASQGGTAQTHAPNLLESRDLIALAVLLALALLVWWVLAFQPFDQLYPIGDPYDYADIGRRIWRGSWRQGLTDGIVPTLALSVSEPPAFLSVVRPPLYPLSLAVAFSLLGPTDQVAAATTSAFFFLTIPLLYTLGRRVFSPVVAFTATLTYILSGGAMAMSTSGLTEPLFTTLLLATILLAYESVQKPHSKIAPLISGVLAGLGYLTRYNMILFVPLIAAYLFLADRDRRWQRVLLFLAAWLITVTPWLTRNLVLFGNPLFSLQQWELLMFTSTFPRFVLYKHVLPPSIPGFLLRHWSDIAVKIGETLAYFGENALTHIWTSGNTPYALVLLLASFFWPLDKPRAALRALVGSMAVVQLLALTLLHPIPRLFFPFYPLLLLFGFNFLVSWLDGRELGNAPPHLHRWLRYLALALVVLFVTLPTLERLPAALRSGFLPQRLPLYNFLRYGDAIDYLQNNTKSGDVFVCNDPKITSWYADRVCVWTPAELDMISQIEAKTPVEGIFLTAHLLTWAEEKAWHEIYTSRPDEILNGRYHLEKVFGQDSLFYRKSQ